MDQTEQREVQGNRGEDEIDTETHKQEIIYT